MSWTMGAIDHGREAYDARGKCVQQVRPGFVPYVEEVGPGVSLATRPVEVS